MVAASASASGGIAHEKPDTGPGRSRATDADSRAGAALCTRSSRAATGARPPSRCGASTASGHAPAPAVGTGCRVAAPTGSGRGASRGSHGYCSRCAATAASDAYQRSAAAVARGSDAKCAAATSTTAGVRVRARRTASCTRASARCGPSRVLPYSAGSHGARPQARCSRATTTAKVRPQLGSRWQLGCRERCGHLSGPAADTSRRVEAAVGRTTSAPSDECDFSRDDAGRHVHTGSVVPTAGALSGAATDGGRIDVCRRRYRGRVHLGPHYGEAPKRHDRQRSCHSGGHQPMRPALRSASPALHVRRAQAHSLRSRRASAELDAKQEPKDERRQERATLRGALVRASPTAGPPAPPLLPHVRRNPATGPSGKPKVRRRRRLPPPSGPPPPAASWPPIEAAWYRWFQARAIAPLRIRCAERPGPNGSNASGTPHVARFVAWQAPCRLAR